MDHELKNERNKRGLKQKEMAKKLDISYSHYVKLENHLVNPSFNLLKKIKTEFPNVDLNKICKSS